MGNKNVWRGTFSKHFEDKLKKGPLFSLLNYAKEDKELDVQFRNNYINIYYKSGNILRIRPSAYEFDKFYFYTDAKNKKEYLGTRKTNILKAAKGDSKAIELCKKCNITQEKAKNIVEVLETKRQELFNKYLTEPSPYDPSKYFEEAKKVMDNWFNVMKKEGINQHEEKEVQHKISLLNQNFANSDLMVLDVEYEISQKASFSNGTNPRADLIAVDKEGRIHVLELKFGLKSIKGNAGVDKHLKDFKNTIQKDERGDFISEMTFLLKQKCRFGLMNVDQDIISKEKEPVFDLVFYYENPEDKKRFEELYESNISDGGVSRIYYLTKDNLWLN